MADPTQTVQSRTGGVRLAVRLAGLAAAWVLLYAINERLWTWLIGIVLGRDLGSSLWGSVHFFVYDTSKIMLLLSGLMFVIGLLRASLNTERARDFLAGRGLFLGLFMAVVLGVVTPFCSCSSIPLFMGFVAAGIPLSITLTFLIASPLVSELAAIMIATQFSVEIAVAYVVAGSVISMAIGFIFSRFDLDKWVEPMVFQTRMAQLLAEGHVPSWPERVTAAREEVREIFGKVWKWVVVGVAIGAVIHGWVPANFFESFAGADNPLAVPLVTVAAVPLYVNGGGVVPIGEALWAKGLPLGTVMSFMMAAIALSIPEGIMLRRVIKPPLLALFFGAVTIGIIIVGYLFNFLFV